MANPALIRLSPPLSPSDIPFHPLLEPLQDSAQCPALGSFVGSALNDALAFAKDDVPSFGAPSKKSKGSTAAVAIKAWQRNGEHWVARKSTHAGKAVAGDGDWAEVDAGLRKDHSRNEAAYTPGVVDAIEVCRWNAEEVGSVEGWSEADMAVYEMKHQLPAPLNARVFTILILSGIPTSSTAGKSFINLTIPLTLSPAGKDGKIETSKYAGSTTVVHGVYTSVEHVYEESDGIVWMMATASDAKGVLPMPIQKLGIPGAIIKDVGLMFSWLDRRRGNSTAGATSTT